MPLFDTEPDNKRPMDLWLSTANILAYTKTPFKSFLLGYIQMVSVLQVYDF